MKNLMPWTKKSEEMMIPRGKDSPFGLIEREMSHLFEDFFEDFEGGFGRGLLPRRGEGLLEETPVSKCRRRMTSSA